MTKTASERLAELAAARAVLHDARESHAPRSMVGALWRQFNELVNSLRGDWAPVRWEPPRLARSVQVHVQHPDLRVERMRQKREHEREILRYEPDLDPRSWRFRSIVEHWCREFDAREGLYAVMRREILATFAGRTQVPYTSEVVALVNAGIRRALRERGYRDDEVEVEVTCDRPDRTLRFHASIPSGIDRVKIHGAMSI